MSNHEERRKLKPMRFNNNSQQPLESFPRESFNSNAAPRRGYKRPNPDLSSSSNSTSLVTKRMCYGKIQPQTKVVNMANNRMKKLKETLQAEVQTSSDLSPNLTPCSSSIPESKNNADHLNSPQISSKSIYKNLEKWASPSEAECSNSASQRLNRLKKVIGETKNSGTPKFNDSSGTQNGQRTLNLESPDRLPKPLRSTSRQVSSNSDREYPDRGNRVYSPLLKEKTNYFNRNKSVSPLLKDKFSSHSIEIKDLSPKNIVSGNNFAHPSNSFCRSNLYDNKSENEINSNTRNDKASLSSRILKIKRNTDQLNNIVNSDVSPNSDKTFSPEEKIKNDNNSFVYPEFFRTDITVNSTPVSQRLKLKRPTEIFSTKESADVKKNKPINNDGFNRFVSKGVSSTTTNSTEISKINENFVPSVTANNTTSNSSKELMNTNEDVTHSSPKFNVQSRLKVKKESPYSKNPSNSTNPKTNTFKEPTSRLVTKEILFKKPSTSRNNSKDTSLLERLKQKKTHSNVFETFHFKEPPKPLTDESLSLLNNPIPKCSKVEEKIFMEEYHEKMAMTESWVRSHQHFSNNPQILPRLCESPVSDDSLQVNLSNVTQKNVLDTSEEMEWTNAEPDSEAGKNQENESLLSNTTHETPKEVPVAPTKDKTLCIIVDTNIFISELSKLTDIINLKIAGPVQPLLYIPWMVVTELDEMKDRSGDNRLKQKAFAAIKYINKVLSEENPRVKGQTISDMSQQNHVGLSPDDKIMGTCLQAVEKYESVILLSNDVNLKNKALINNIAVASSNEIIMKIMSKLIKTTKTQKVMLKVSMLFSEIICNCAKDAYGDVWTKMDMLASPPWSLTECLKRFKKYWTAVFQEKLMKHFMVSVDKLLQFMAKNQGFCDDSDQYCEFVKLCLNLCIFLKDIEEYRGPIEKTMDGITKV